MDIDISSQGWQDAGDGDFAAGKPRNMIQQKDLEPAQRSLLKKAAY
ncbi:MAG TPA: hypothetical protein VHW92_06630 [Mycobacteriales bacterium]|nr:hypothetical protein [Mycobacteriales bacterium]